MTRTITALFDARSDAEAAKARLEQSNVDADHIHIHDKTSSGYNETGNSTHAEPGIWASIKNAFLPDHDRHTYEEGVRRGGVLLTADVSEDTVGDAVRVLEDAATVDIDARAESWRESGWNYEAAAGVAGGDTRSRSDLATFDANAQQDLSDEPSIYGRRELDRGSARARSYVQEPYVATTGNRVQGHGAVDTARGLTDEALGNVKQAAGSLFGNERLEQEGVTQERKGEAEQGKPTTTHS
jgi:uncharacterized protein YjbJ (UPF0337 family)